MTAQTSHNHSHSHHEALVVEQDAGPVVKRFVLPEHGDDIVCQAHLQKIGHHLSGLHVADRENGAGVFCYAGCHGCCQFPVLLSILSVR